MGKKIKPASQLLQILVKNLYIGCALTLIGMGVCGQGVQAVEAQEVLFVEVPASVTDARNAAAALRRDKQFFARYANGSHILIGSLDDPSRPAVNLTQDFIAACDPSVSFDGEAILFAGKKNLGDYWQIWQVRRNGSGLKQLVKRNADCVSPLWAGPLFHLDDTETSDQILFVSTESMQSGHPDNVYSLYACDTTGHRVTRITHNPYSDYNPTVLPNGRVVYTGWREADSSLHSSLQAVSIDGTDLMPFYGNFEPPRIKEMAAASANERVYFIEAEQSDALGGGALSYVSRRRPLKTHAVLTQEKNGFYTSPCPLPDGGLLASYRRAEEDSCYGVYRLSPDSGERIATVRQTPGWHCVDTQVLAPRDKVRGRATVVDVRAKVGVFYCLDVYQSDRPEMQGVPRGTVKTVQVLQGNEAQLGTSKVLGSAPVEPDGSFQIEVPADVPLALQLLNEKGQTIAAQKTWTWVKPRENRGCIGCHEDRELAPPNRLVEAIKKPAAKIVPDLESGELVDNEH